MRSWKRGIPTLLALIASLAIVAAGASAAGKTKTYAGLSSERIPISFKVSGGKVKSFNTQIGYSGNCGSGGGPGYTVKASSIAIKNKKFSKTVTGTGPPARRRDAAQVQDQRQADGQQGEGLRRRPEDALHRQARQRPEELRLLRDVQPDWPLTAMSRRPSPGLPAAPRPTTDGAGAGAALNH
jgi:hypothetical protein